MPKPRLKVKVGELYGAWEVLETLPKAKAKCLCTSCGKVLRVIKRSDLVAGKTRMCRPCSRAQTGTRTEDDKIREVYSTWMSMIQRCHNPSSKDYKNYGARGITVCDMWRDSFDAFYMMMGPKPAANYTIERIDYNKGYEPGNVKWLPREEQPFNQRSNIHITIDGETRVASLWEGDPRCPVTKKVIYKRLDRGWPPEAAVRAPNGTKLQDWLRQQEENKKVD